MDEENKKALKKVFYDFNIDTEYSGDFDEFYNEYFGYVDKDLKEALESIKLLQASKCKSCGCPDGIHRADCSFMSKYI